MRVRFLESVIYETEGLGKGVTYDKDSLHDLREDIAQRWIRRGKAELVPDEQPSTVSKSEGRPKLKLAAKE